MYNDFARIYDKLQPDSEYEKFANYMEEIFARFEKSPKLILDLACGTGRLTAILAARGYDMIGVDISDDALNLAAERAKSTSLEILFLHQDMTDFELFGTIDAIVCCFDSVNYVTDLRSLRRMFKLCENYLNPGGLLIFDINTPRKFEKTLANNTFVFDSSSENESFEDIFCIWENNYSRGRNEFHLTFFEKSDEIGGNYARFEETHVQRCYEFDEIEKLFLGLKMSRKACCHEFSFNSPRQSSERIFYIFEKDVDNA